MTDCTMPAHAGKSESLADLPMIDQAEGILSGIYGKECLRHLGDVCRLFPSLSSRQARPFPAVSAAGH